MYSKWKHISLAHFEKVNQSALTPTEQEIQLLHINQSTSTDSSAKKQDHKKDNKQKKKTKATKKRRLLDSDENDFLEEEHHSESESQSEQEEQKKKKRKQKPQEEPESDEQEEKSDDEKNQVTDEEKTDEEETETEEETEEEEEEQQQQQQQEKEEEPEEEEEEEQQQQQQEKEEEPDEQQDNDKAEERQQTKGDQQEDLDEEEDQQQEQEEQQTNQQEEVNEQELTNQQEELQEKSNIFHAQGHDQPQTPTKEDDKDKLISAMRAQMQEIEQKFMAELRKKDQLKEMSTKKTGSPQQRSMVKRIKQKSRKQAHDPDFEYQPMTKPKEDARNKTQTAADVPKPTQGTDEEKEKKNDNKKEGAHEAKQQQKEKMQEHIGQEKAVTTETNPKEHANQKKTKLQVLENDDDFQEESIPNKPLIISCRKTNKVWHSLSKKDQDQIQLINNTQSSACVWSGSEDENCVYFSDICRLTNREPLYGNVIDAFSEKQLALQPTIEEFEKNDIVFASNLYAGRSYVFSTLINTPLQNQDQALREKLMDSHFPEAMKNRYIYFPINHDNHWTIVVFDNADGIWRHYDSLRPAKDCHNKHFEIAKQIQQHQLRWNKALFSKQGNMLSSQECETEIASIEECPQQTPHSMIVQSPSAMLSTNISTGNLCRKNFVQLSGSNFEHKSSINSSMMRTDLGNSSTTKCSQNIPNHRNNEQTS
ncbi:unnamed protein product [Camellia sinensis]